MKVWEEHVRPEVDQRLFRSFDYGSGQSDVAGRGRRQASSGATSLSREDAIKTIRSFDKGNGDLGEAMKAMMAYMADDPDREMRGEEKKLFWAMEQGDEAGAIDVLSKTDWESDPKTAQHRTLFHAGIDAQMYELMAIGMELGFDVDEVDAEGWPAIVHAASKNDARAIKLLVEEGEADADAMTRMGWSAMTTALNRGHWEAAGALLDVGVSADAEDGMGRTARALAGSVPMPEWLKQRIADAS